MSDDSKYSRPPRTEQLKIPGQATAQTMMIHEEKPQKTFAPIAIVLIVGGVIGFALLMMAMKWNYQADFTPQVAPTPTGAFVGRFHPLVLHFPIALIAFAALMEFLCLKKSLAKTLQPAVLAALWVGLLGMGITLASGWLLGLEGGYNKEVLSKHANGAMVLGGLIFLTLLFRQIAACALNRFCLWISRLFLLASVGLLGMVAHEGGVLSHGATWLSEYAPEPLKNVYPFKNESISVKPQGVENSVFVKTIVPILQAKCMDCHSEAKKVKGKYKMDSHSELLAGGGEGKAIEAGNLDGSYLVELISLPDDDDDKMPPTDEEPLTTQEIAILKWWIEKGASPTATEEELGGIPAQ